MLPLKEVNPLMQGINFTQVNLDMSLNLYPQNRIFRFIWQQKVIKSHDKQETIANNSIRN